MARHDEHRGGNDEQRCRRDPDAAQVAGAFGVPVRWQAHRQSGFTGFTLDVIGSVFRAATLGAANSVV
jgi:hypothetical protein